MSTNPMSTKALLTILLAGTAGVVFFLYVHMSANGGKIEVGTSKAVACDRNSGDCLPDVTYIDTTGKKYDLASLNGKVVVVNFWASWCGPCKSEIPDLSKVYDHFKDRGVVFLGVMTDQAGDQELLNFASDHEMTYPIVRASSDIITAYHYPQALPTTFVFSRGGKQVFSHVGAISEGALSGLLDQYVAEK